MDTINFYEKLNYKLIIITMISLFLSCSSIPKGIKAVTNFNKDKYLGKWYEIARFDVRFEKGLNNTTAEYSIRDDGKIKVINRGYKYETKEWKQAIGKAKFVGKDNIAMLKVSFFGPFYFGYNVIALDDDYKYALVIGSNFDYLWILARDTTIPDNIKTKYLKIAKDYGFKIENIIWVEHNQ